MSRPATLSWRFLGIAPLLTLVVGCGDSPTSSDTVALRPSFASQTSDVATSAAARELTAHAVYYANPPLVCKETEAEITASETAGGDATLDFTYSVLGVCGDAQGLYYYDLSTEGAVPIDPSDLYIHPGLRRASLDTEVTVFDAEGGVYGTIRIQASWERARGQGGGKGVVADLEVSGGFLSQQYLTNPLDSSVSAELTRSGR